jgi:hypothetical protein
MKTGLLEPLTLTQANWPLFNEVWEMAFGHTPTRQLETEKIPRDDPVSFISCLDPGKSSLGTLREAPMAQRHLHISCIGIFEPDEVFQLATNTDLELIISHSQKGEVCVASATIDIWVAQIEKHCTAWSTLELRKIFNHLFDIFCQTRTKELFARTGRLYQRDGTFVIH